MKILVTGVTGFLGRYLLKFMPQGHLCIAHSRTKLALPSNTNSLYSDMTNDHFIEKVAAVQPEMIIHNAAMANVDTCERDRRSAFRVNTQTTRRLAQYAGENDIRFVFISSDQVFDGRHGLYVERDTPHPVNYYGETKLAGEQAVREMTENHVIIRGALFYGKSLGGRISFTEHLFRQLTAGRTVNVFDDQYRSPVLVDDLARLVWKMALTSLTGIFHLGGPDRLSRLEMGEILCRELGLDADLLNPVKTESVNLAATRGLDCSVDSSKIIQQLNEKICCFAEGLKLSFPS